MPATVIVRSLHGATGTIEVTVSGSVARYNKADSENDNHLLRVVIPPSGEAYSWRKLFKAQVTVTPGGAISNLRYFTDGSSPGTGIAIYAHKTPDYTRPSAADELGLIDQGAGTPVEDQIGYTSGSPLVINAGTVLSNPSIGFGIQDFVETQLVADSSAALGAASQPQVFYRWDES
jgi:hypothetical protein